MRLPKREFWVSEVGAEVEYFVFVFVFDYLFFLEVMNLSNLGVTLGR